MKKIAILYICTGPYSIFWKDFFDSFETYFLKNTEVHYYVFTDTKELYMENRCNRIHKVNLKSEPWPLPTLLKFKTFLDFEEELATYDYLYQSNANIVCNAIVEEKTFLPDSDKELIFTIHPGFMNKKSFYCPYDRNKKSKAYVPYNKKSKYVFGAMNGGTAEAYLKLIKELEHNIEEDLKKNVIAKWHDESHINWYVTQNNNYKILSPSFCYPVGFDVAYEKIIVGVDKASKFDVNIFKGNYKKKETAVQSYCRKIKNAWNTILKPIFFYIRDSILNK